MVNPQSDNFDPKTKKTGIAHFFAATTYSIGGLKCLFKEAAFRQELFFAIFLLVIYAAIGVKLEHAVISACLILITFATEALNTAIELLVDKASPEISDFARNAKDLGSFATMCLLVANGCYTIFAISTALEWI